MGIVLIEDAPNLAIGAYPAFIQPHRRIAIIQDQLRAVRRQNEYARAPDKALHALRGLFLERDIACTQPLVQDKDLWFESGGNRERQSHPHTGRVGVHRHVQKLTQL